MTLRVQVAIANLDGVGEVIVRHRWNYTAANLKLDNPF
jgi:hypothetical protein